MDFKKGIFAILLFCLGVAFLPALHAEDAPAPSHTLVVFYSSSCQKCLRINEALMPDIEQEFRGRLRVEYRDTNEIENYQMMLSLRQHYGHKGSAEVPLFFLEGRFIDSRGNLRERLLWFINDALNRKPLDVIRLPRIDLNTRLEAFRPLAVAGAGLIDGINPCAFTVIVFFVSYLALQRYRRKEIVVVGLSFITAVFISYILIGSGLFGFLYRLKNFWLISHALNLLIGVACIVLGILALYDFFIYVRTRRTEGQLLQLPQALKNRIHGVIGRFHRRQARGAEASARSSLAGMVISAFVSGFLVSVIEAACTGQVYLPTLVFIFKTSGFNLQALSYLVLYNVMFIVPLCAIFLCALLGVTSEQFSAFLKKHFAPIKFSMVLLFFALGAVLLYLEAPDYGAPEQVNQTYETEWDFGRVKERSPAVHDFYLRNESQRPLQIQEVATSCGCTVSRLEKRLLQPGESTRLRVRFDGTGYQGPVQQYIYVHTDDLDNPVRRFIIKADVVKE